MIQRKSDGITSSNIQPKKVTFDPEVKVLNMWVWSFAYSEARKNDWMQIAADQDRFKRRIHECNKIISPILNSERRRNIAATLNIL